MQCFVPHAKSDQSHASIPQGNLLCLNHIKIMTNNVATYQRAVLYYLIEYYYKVYLQEIYLKKYFQQNVQ